MKFLKKYMLALVFLIFFIPRIIGLGSDISNYDAGFWHPRIDSFTNNLLKGNLGKTYQKYHPGVTVLWLGGASKYTFEQLVQYKYGYNPRYMSVHFIKVNFVTIFPLITVISLLGVMVFYFVKNLTDTKLALTFSILLSLEPFFLGITKFLHLTGLQSMFILAALFSLYYFYTVNKKRFFYISAILAGLACLTKIDSLILVAFATFFIIYKDRKNLKTLILNLFLYNSIVVTVFFIFFPALWVHPILTLQKMYLDGIQDTAFANDGDDTLSNIPKLFYIESLFLRTLPSTFILFFVGIYGLFKQKSSSKKSFLIFNLLFLLFNLIVLSIPSKTIDRYLINFLPSFIFIAAFGIYKILAIKSKPIFFIICILIIGWYLVTFARYYPVYSFYYTDLIGAQPGLSKLNFSIKNRGEYYAQAAQYINQTDPDAITKNAVVTESTRVITFSPFFYGSTYPDIKELPEGRSAAYVIIRSNAEKNFPEDKCSFLKSFGPKAPLQYDEVLVYKCSGYKEE